MHNLPPPPPPHAIVREAEPDIQRALLAHARQESSPAHQQQDYRHVQQQGLREATERRRRQEMAVVRGRQTTSQRY